MMVVSTALRRWLLRLASLFDGFSRNDTNLLEAGLHAAILCFRMTTRTS
jgi:hypothetical protein